MVSRRKILSRSRDELHSDIYYMAEDDDDDVWHSKDKLYRVRMISNVYLYRKILKFRVRQITFRIPSKYHLLARCARNDQNIVCSFYTLPKYCKLCR